MEFLDYPSVSFGSNGDMGRLCIDLDYTVRAGIWYDTFSIENTKCLWFENNIVAAMNSDKVLCGVFGMHPSFVAGILGKAEEINFYVLCNNKLKYSDYMKNPFQVSSVTFLLFGLRETISSYGLVEKLLYQHLKQETWRKTTT